jgi:hypothetical protein
VAEEGGPERGWMEGDWDSKQRHASVKGTGEASEARERLEESNPVS